MFTLIVYGIPNCPNCETAKRIGAEKGCDVSYVDISDADSEARKDFAQAWDNNRKEEFPRSVPIVYVDEIEQFMTFREFMSWIKTVL